MSVQSVSQLSSLSASSASLFLPFATRALVNTLSARANSTVLRNTPQNITRFNSVADSRIAQLQVQAQRSAGTQSVLQGASSTLTLIDDKLATIQSLAATAQVASSGQRASLNSAAQALVSDIVGSAANFLNRNPNAVIKAKAGDPQASAANQVFKNVRILNSSVAIPDEGLSFTFDVTNNTGATFNRSGARGSRLNGIVDGGTIGIIDNDVSFIVAGSRGQYQFDVVGGTSTADLAAQINAQKEVTGVQVFIDAGDDFDFYSLDYGNGEFAQVIELVDSGLNELRGGAGSGTNAQADITDNQTGETITVEADGRRFAFSLSGLDFEIDIYEDINPTTGVALANENNNRPARLITVEGSGIQLYDTGDSRLSLPELSVSNLTRTGLLSLDLVSNPDDALTIVDGLREDLASPIARISTSLATVANSLARSATTIATIEQSRSDIVDIDSLIRGFERIRNEAREQAGYALLSQIGTLFPNSVLPLVGLPY